MIRFHSLAYEVGVRDEFNSADLHRKRCLCRCLRQVGIVKRNIHRETKMQRSQLQSVKILILRLETKLTSTNVP